MAKVAATQALKDAKLDSPVAAAASLCGQAMASVILYLALGSFTEMTTATRSLTAAAPFLAFPVALIIRLVSTPGVMAREASEVFQRELTWWKEANGNLIKGLNALTDPPRPPDFEDGIYQNGSLVGKVIGMRTTDHKITFEQIENTEALDRNKAFYFQDILLMIVDFGGLTASQNRVIIDKSGARTVTAKAVIQRVTCRSIGDVRTVKRPGT
ncbi:hypothetical protein [Sphingomonas arantia]|uniref:hypothetical protein n=1 Tax=Sphingomonas arantia TaxID=1460676 RepID=UPI0036D29CB5